MDTATELEQLQGVKASAGQGPQVYFKRDKDGNMVPIQVERTDHVLVSEGYYKLRVTGITPLIAMDGQYGPSKNVRVEFTVNMPKTAEHKKRFSQLFAIQRFDAEQNSWYSAVTPKTQTGKLIGAIRNREIERGETVDITAIVGQDVMGFVTINAREKDGTTYRDSRIVKDGFRPVGSTDIPSAPEPADDLDAAPVAAPEPVAAHPKPVAAPSAFSDDLDGL